MTVADTPLPSRDLAPYRSEFPIFERQVYLNSCSLGALSRRSRARVNAAKALLAKAEADLVRAEKLLYRLTSADPRSLFAAVKLAAEIASHQ